MTDFDKTLINIENIDGPKFALILDDHKKHIKSHLRYPFTCGMIKHILQHISLYFRAKKLGVPTISLSEVMDFTGKKGL